MIPSPASALPVLMMAERQFPVTKFAPAGAGPTLARPRLLSRFAPARLVLVCAGPGYGKTTLLRSAVQSSAALSAWVSLDEGDRLPGRFLTALEAALRLAGERAGRQVSDGPPTDGSGEPEAALAALVNRLAAYGDPILLVLDDYQRVSDAEAPNAVLEYLLSYLPPNVMVALGTRVRPSVPSMGRLFAQGAAVELTSADLRFNAAETLELLAGLFGLELGGLDLERLDRRLEGWSIALQAWRQEALARGRSLEQVDANPAGALRIVRDYLRAEVLGAQTPLVRRFLIESAALDELDAETCNAVLNRSDAGTLLEEIERQNLLVSRDGLGRLRYHPLLREYLRDLLGQRADRRRRLALSAASFFGARGDAVRAVEHLLEAAEWEAAATRIVRLAPTALEQGLPERLSAWVERFPAAALERQPALLVRYGEVLHWQGRTEAAARWFERAVASGGAGGESGLAAVAASPLALAVVAQPVARRGPEALVEFYRGLLAGPAGETSPARPVVLAALALAELAAGRPLLADELVEQALAACSWAVGECRPELDVLVHDGFWVAYCRGRFAAALEAAERARLLAERSDRAPERCRALIAAGDALVSLGRLVEAQQVGEAALASARRLGLRLLEADALRLLGSALLAGRAADRDAALGRYLEALALLEPHTQADRALEARVCLDLTTLHRRSGHRAEAVRLAQRALERLRLVEPLGRLLEPAALLALGLAHLDADPPEAERLVRQARLGFERAGDRSGLARCDLWLAVLAHARSTDDCVVHLQSALEEAGQAGSVQLLVDEAARAVPLLVAALERGISSEGVEELLVRAGAEAAGALVPLIVHPEAAVRRRAITLLGKIGDVRSRRPLLRGLKDEDPTVREAVRAALSTLGLPETPFLRVRMFGHFVALRDDEPIADGEWKTRKAKMLFKYLLVHKGRFIPQERLIDLLWPEADLRSASMNLRTTLALLRRALEPLLEGSASRFILHQGESVAFNAEIPHWVDTEEFLERYRTGRRYEAKGLLDQAAAEYEAADRLYTGDFLEEDVYEDWTLADRERYREVHSELLLRLADIKAQWNEYEEAIALCQRVIARDECREDVHRRLMQLHWKAGRPIQAVRQYHACASALRRELGVGPALETRRLFERLQRELDDGPESPGSH